MTLPDTLVRALREADAVVAHAVAHDTRVRDAAPFMSDHDRKQAVDASLRSVRLACAQLIDAESAILAHVRGLS